MSLADKTPAKTIDVKGKICPYPLIEARNALKTLASAEVLEVITDYEPAALESIPNMCRKKSFKFETEQRDDVWHILIEKAE